jgi:hypothetical protein
MGEDLEKYAFEHPALPICKIYPFRSIDKNNYLIAS